MEEVREFEIPKNRPNLEADVTISQPLKHRLSNNSMPGQLTTMLMASTAVLMNFDPIFMWIALFISFTLVINGQPTLAVRLTPTLFGGMIIFRYAMIVNGKAPQFNNIFPPLFKQYFYFINNFLPKLL